jgi:hypothetical protein
MPCDGYITIPDVESAEYDRLFFPANPKIKDLIDSSCSILDLSDNIPDYYKAIKEHIPKQYKGDFNITRLRKLLDL